MIMKIGLLRYLVLSAGFITFLSCKEKKAETGPLVPEVNVVTAGQRTIPFYTEYVGETFGKEDIQIQSRIEGWITSIQFKEGEMVQKGQLLYTIDDLPIKNKIDQAEANLAQANTAKVKNKAELDRVEPLTQMHALSQRDLDAAKANYQASLSQVDAAQAALRNAKIELSYARITAPISGIIGTTKYWVGDFIGKINTGAPLNVISSVNSIRARFSISEDEYLKFAKLKKSSASKLFSENIPVEMILSDGTKYNQIGSINLTNRQIDPATGSLLIQAIFDNPQGLIKPGQYVKLKLKTDEFKDAILIPQQSIIQIQNIFQVFVLNDSNKVTPVVIKPGKRIGSNWIVNEGVKVGDKLAIIGSAAIKPSLPVKPTLIQWNYDSTSQQ
jgi:membrane fusion protein (multidrug efflux system)